MTVVRKKPELEKMVHGGYKMDINACKAQIKRHEGEVLEIYLDARLQNSWHRTFMSTTRS